MCRAEVPGGSSWLGSGGGQFWTEESARACLTLVPVPVPELLV